MLADKLVNPIYGVAPLAGAWIEISLKVAKTSNSQSLPSRERGLKSVRISGSEICLTVAPLAGAWIEIAYIAYANTTNTVAPLAGAWIEICSVTALRRVV